MNVAARVKSGFVCALYDRVRWTTTVGMIMGEMIVYLLYMLGCRVC